MFDMLRNIDARTRLAGTDKLGILLLALRVEAAPEMSSASVGDRECLNFNSGE